MCIPRVRYFLAQHCGAAGSVAVEYFLILQCCQSGESTFPIFRSFHRLHRTSSADLSHASHVRYGVPVNNLLPACLLLVPSLLTGASAIAPNPHHCLHHHNPVANVYNSSGVRQVDCTYLSFLVGLHLSLLHLARSTLHTLPKR